MKKSIEELRKENEEIKKLRQGIFTPSPAKEFMKNDGTKAPLPNRKVRREIEARSRKKSKNA